ncbi:uncharacterized protein YbcV (DUF1398 family) [Pedobacter psychrotolerans]|uniref:Uncharacterized protein YbcV (DUF1398 family) n=1 Tax=Pedobacter psychrotolerans TaxID=1843235 RepID=A0A4R2H7N5_9SPHI|nr:DUF1398 family protein [Pedobacter psychrotolerans]TCO22486.1 uncharacterized protein YbcV (DUF1398 family) [Pedobacter psychrotolerans]GGE64946.1 hypothetical protein GCM10011413_34240 [Pedobacter psychrotolerans]
MVTKEDIQAAESKITKGSDFPQFIKEIKTMGVIRNDVYVSNGLSVYFDSDNQVLQISPEEYPELVVNEESSEEKLTHALEIHQKGETDYITFCKQAADAGVEKWITDLEDMTCTYLNSEGNELLKENISSI